MLDGFKERGITERGIKFRPFRDGIATGPERELGGAMAEAMVTIVSAFAQLKCD